MRNIDSQGQENNSKVVINLNPVLRPDDVFYSQSLIGVIGWMIKIVPMHINPKVFTFSNVKTGALGGSTAYHGLPEPQV